MGIFQQNKYSKSPTLRILTPQKWRFRGPIRPCYTGTNRSIGGFKDSQGRINLCPVFWLGFCSCFVGILHGAEPFWIFVFFRDSGSGIPSQSMQKLHHKVVHMPSTHSLKDHLGNVGVTPFSLLHLLPSLKLTYR